MTIESAHPYPFDFEIKQTALVLIDFQRDFLEPGGFGASLSNDVSLLRAALGPARTLLDAARRAGLLIIHTREGHRPDLVDMPPAKMRRGNPTLRIGDTGKLGRLLIRGEAGHGIVPELAPLAGEPIVDKPGKGAFYATDLETLLQCRQIHSLLICGVTTEVCVHTTVREANDRGYDGLLLVDCTESYFPAFKASAIQMIHAQGGIVGWTSSSAQLVDALTAIHAD